MSPVIRTQAEVVDRVIAAVTAVDGVAGLHAGGPGGAATYLPGRTVAGVRLGYDGGQVNVVLELQRHTDLIEIADRVRRAATDASGGLPFSVVVSDVTVPTNRRDATPSVKEPRS